MRILKAVFVGLTLALLVGTLLNPAEADTWNKKTVITFSQPIEIPLPLQRDREQTRS